MLPSPAPPHGEMNVAAICWKNSTEWGMKRKLDGEINLMRIIPDMIFK